MNISEFEAQLKADGFAAEKKSLSAGLVVKEHSHPFDARALILDGDIMLTVDGAATTYRAGDVFNMKAGCRHSENVGGSGCTYIVGRRPVDGVE